MKRIMLTLILSATFGLVTVNANNLLSSVTSVVCDGEHKCDDKCKKDKDGKCAEVKSDDKESTETAKSCCKKDQKSCSDFKSKKEKTEKEDPKS